MQWQLSAPNAAWRQRLLRDVRLMELLGAGVQLAQREEEATAAEAGAGMQLGQQGDLPSRTGCA